MSDVDPYSLWRISTDRRFQNLRRPAPAYLTRDQVARWARIMQARQIYTGQHYEYFITDQRSLWDYPNVSVNGQVVRRMVPFNLVKRIVDSSAALLFGAEPLISVDDAVQSARLQSFARRTDLHAILVETEIECSSCAEAVLEACIDDGEVYLKLIPAEQIHPLGAMRPDRQYAAYVRYAEANVGTDANPINLILATTYRAGVIERRLYQDEVRSERLVKLSEWPEFKRRGVAPPEDQKTGLDVNTIVWLPNQLYTGQVVSDIDGLIEHQDTLNASHTGMFAALDRHRMPKLVAPRAAADDQGNIRASSDVLYADDPNEWKYLTWDAAYDAQEKRFDRTIEAMCVMSETAPVLLGIDGGKVPDSARGLRLRAMSSTSKAARKATLRRPAITWVLDLVQMLEQTIPGNRYDRPAQIAMQLRDGLPVDEEQQAQTVATYRGAGAMSLEDAVKVRITDPAEREAEVERIRAEAAAAMPAVLLGNASANVAAPVDSSTDQPSTVEES